MFDQTNFIDLSEESIQEALDICRKVEIRNAKNETSVRMAHGIAEYLTAHGFLSRKQAEWLARNADYYRHPRPNELADIVLPTKTSPSTVTVTAASTSTRPLPQRDVRDVEEVRELLVSLREELGDAIARLRT